jgi:uncharacterized protein (TIGR03437 family)
MRSAIRAIGIILSFSGSLAFGQANPTITAIVDPYTGSTNLAPGGLALIQGTSLGIAPRVTVGGEVAYTVIPPVYSGGAKITIQIPVDLPPGPTTVVVSPMNLTVSFPITLTQYAPVLVSSASGTLLSPAHQSGVPVTAGAPATQGESIVISAIGLGPTSPAVGTGVAAPSGAATTTTPTLTFAGKTVSGVTAVLQQGSIGIYQVTFTVPASTAPGNYPVSLSIGGASSNTFQLAVSAAAAAAQIAAILDPVLGSTSLSPGGLATLYGLNLGSNPVVTIGGKAAAVLATPQSGQLTIQIPVDAATGRVNVTVGNSAPYSITLSQYSPVLYNSTAVTNFSPTHVNTGAPVTAANPALPNEQIAVFGTGFGPTNPVVPTGTPAPAKVSPAQPVNVLLNNVPVSGPTVTLVQDQVGVFEIVFTVPASPATGNFVTFSVQVGPAGNQVRSYPVLLVIALNSAAPTISGLSNIYSYIVPGMPNYGIAQGSIFAIFGTNLSGGPTNGLLQPPLGTQANGASATITVNGTSTNAILYYASPSQLVAILPSATPGGDGAITVSNGLSRGAPFAIHVVQSGFGILTLNGAGSGPAAAFDVDYNYLGFTNALNPGDTFILWGTGVGPVSGNEAVTQTPVDLGNEVPMSLEVGGMPAQLVYHGRSTFPGLDEVIGVVPQGVSPGCWVSVVAQTGNVMSNFATLPVAASGRTCSDPVMGLTTSAVQTLSSKSSLNLGFLQLAKDGGVQPNNGTTSLIINDVARAQFLNVKSSDFASFTLGPSIGSCMVSRTYASNEPWGGLPSTGLDAGSTIDITGPLGSATLPYQSAVDYLVNLGLYLVPPDTIPWQGGGGVYGAQIGGPTMTAILPSFIASDGGGTFTFANGTGGSAVGAFTAQVPFLGPPLFSWPQLSSIMLSNLSLSGGITINWSGADPNSSYIQITGRDSTANNSGSVQFVCAVPADAEAFNIPASVLLSLPVSPSSLAGGDPAFTPRLQVSQVGYGQIFSAPGIDLGFAQSLATATTAVFFQK